MTADEPEAEQTATGAEEQPENGKEEENEMNMENIMPENAMAAVIAGIEVYLPLAGLIDVEKETQRLNKELESMDKEIKRVTGKLNNAGFLAKAPADVVEKEKAKAEELSGKMEAVKERLTYLATLK